MTMRQSQPPKVIIDERRFLTVDGIPVCKVLPDGQLQFKDKDKHRANKRGGEFVTASVEEIRQAVESQSE